MERVLGKLVTTFEKPYDSSVIYVFIVLAVISILGLGCTGVVFFVGTPMWVWITIGVISVILTVLTVLGFIGDTLHRVAPERLRIHKNGFIYEQESASYECYWVDIAGVTYQPYGVFPGFTIRRFDEKEGELKFDFELELNEEIYELLCKETIRHLLRDATADLDDGDCVRFGPDLEIEDGELTLFQKSFDLDDVDRIKVAPTMSENVIIDREIRFHIEGEWSDHVIQFSTVENPHLFLELVQNRYKIKCIRAEKVG